jgi:hypothetical protein
MASDNPFLFVSHVSEDVDASSRIVDELERRGIRCWIAPRNVQAGKPFDDQIAEAIDQSRAMLLVFSERCNESDYIRREVTVAGEAGKIIIPFRIENAEPKRGLRVRLSDLHWIDGFVARERALDEVLRTVGTTTNQEATELQPETSGITPNREHPQHAPKENAPGNALGRLVSGALIVQGGLRALITFYLWNKVALIKPSDAWLPFFALSLLLSACTIAVALGAANQSRRAYLLAVILCAIGAAHDGFFFFATQSATDSLHFFTVIFDGMAAPFFVIYMLGAIYFGSELWRNWRTA